MINVPENIPVEPGVYLMKNKDSQVIYVGKAKSLKNRVKTYFTGSYDDPKVALMMGDVEQMEFITTQSELDAIFLEARLIKDIKPKYNIQLKDDKSFTSLVLTDYDDFPKVWLAHQTDDVKGTRYGPFPSTLELRKAVKVLQKIFKFATCSLTIREDDPKRRYFRPCLLHYIGQCSAPCTTAINKRDYNNDMKSLITFLKGDKESLISELEIKMKTEAMNLNFERAVIIRDQASALKSTQDLFSKYISEGDITPISPKDANAELNRLFGINRSTIFVVEALDISHLSGQSSVGSIVRFVEGVPYKSGYRRYKIRTVKGIDDYAMVREVLGRRIKRGMADNDLPDLILIDGGIGQLKAAEEVRTLLKPEKDMKLTSLAKKEETLYDSKLGKMDISKNNLGLRLLMYARDEAHRFAKNYNVTLRRKSFLGKSGK